MRLRWLSVVVGVALASCSFDDGGVVPDGSGRIDAGVDAEVCAPGCDEGVLVTCSDGTEQRTACPLGCLAEATPHCAQLVPSNEAELTNLTDVPTTGDLVVPDGERYTIYTDTGRIEDEDEDTVRAATVSGGIDAATGIYYRRLTDSIAVLAVDSMTVESGATIVGEGTRGLIVLSRGDVVVRGVIDFSAGCLSGPPSNSCGGPGGGNGATVAAGSVAGGCAPGGNGVGAPLDTAGNEDTGGGGGALGAVSAPGGSVNIERSGGAAGNPADRCPGPALVPLKGGSGGGVAGARAGGTALGGIGGGGGGAIQITSLTSIAVDGVSAGVPAVIDVGGGGGQSPPTAATSGGGGGGAGGGVLLEAPMVFVSADAILVANGGGGGSGRSPAVAVDGANGTRTTAQAAGGPDNEGTGAGGRGGARAGGATAGATAGLDGTGGGGGSVGIIRINGRAIMNTSPIVSPAASSANLMTE